MTESEISLLRLEKGIQLAVEFPKAPFAKRLRNKKFTSAALKRAVKEWITDKCVMALYGHISDWDVSEVTDMSDLFKDAKSFDEDISGWDVSKVENMSGIFSGAISFNKEYTRKWSLDRLTRRDRTKKYTNEKLKQAAKDWVGNSIIAEALYGHISDWDVSEVTDMSDLFKDATDFNEDVSRWDMSKVRRAKNIFDGIEAFNKKYTKDWSGVHTAVTLDKLDDDTDSHKKLSALGSNVEQITECATAWSVITFAITSLYTGVHVAFAMSKDSTLENFTVWFLTPSCLTAQTISFVLKPRREDFAYKAFLYSQYFFFTIGSEVLFMVGYSWEMRRIIEGSTRCLFWLIFLFFGIQVRLGIARLSDKDLSDFISIKAFKGSLMIGLGQLAFLGFSIVQCQSEAR